MGCAPENAGPDGERGGLGLFVQYRQEVTAEWCATNVLLLQLLDHGTYAAFLSTTVGSEYLKTYKKQQWAVWFYQVEVL